MNQQRQRGIAATQEGKLKLEQAKAATRDETKNNRPWTYAKIAEVAGCEETTVKAFFGKKGEDDRVDKSYALAIIKALKLEPNDIIDVSDITNSINWKTLCTDAFKQEQERRKRATEMGHEVEVYVPLGLVQRQQQPRRTGEEMPGAEAGMQQYALREEEIQKSYEHQEFLNQVIGNAGKNLAIIGEPGAGKTTWLDQIGQYLIDQKKSEAYPIWIPLARLQGMTLENYLREEWLKEKLQVLQPTGEQKQEFMEWFKTGKVWLLLDGVDEMSAALPVVEIRDSLQREWVKQARVVLSCRLNVWESNPTTLEGFETYRTLCFEPEQVEQFITVWFAREQKPELGQQLAQKLQEAESARILDLVRNPLRLSLLCKSWVNNPGKIPVTKADLYQQFRRDVYGWKQDKFPTTFRQQQQLNQKLAELALRGMRENVPLRETLVHEVLGEWFELAQNVGWLNVVYRDTRTDEPVYAFFHLTFQEYFAACAVADGQFFLPSDHSPAEPSSQPYRIFESRWREVILLWLGRGDVEDEKKEAFIEALVSFEDGCYGDFYEARAYFLAAAGISEFKACSLADEIVRQVVKWGFGYFDIEKQEWQTFLDPIKEAARKAIPETIRRLAITELSTIVENCPKEDIWRLAAESLGKIAPGNPEAIAALLKIITTTEDETTRWRVASSLGEIAPGNPEAISGLLKIIATTEDEDTRRQAVESLGKIAPGNPEAIAALLKIITTTEDETTRWRVASSLGEIAPGNPEAIAALLKIITTTKDKTTRWLAASSLGEIAPGNPEAISGLLKIIATTEDEDTRWQAIESLGRIAPGNPEAIAALLKIITTTKDKTTRWLAAESLGEIAPGNPEAIAGLLKIIATTEDEDTWRQAIESLGRIEPGNPEAIAGLLKIIATTEDEDTWKAAARSFGRIEPGNPEAIAGLLKIIATTEDETTRWLAASSLEKIAPGNPEVITALLKIIATTEDETTRWLAASSLEKIAPGNPEVITALLKIIATTEDEDTWRAAARSFGRIEPGNPEAIAALLKVIATTEDETTRREAVGSLGRIAPGNPEAIAALLKVIATTEDETTRREAVGSLGRIAPGNPEAIAALLKVIATTEDERTRRRAVGSLGWIARGNPEAIAALLKVIATTEDERTWREAVGSLGRIAPGNPEAIAALLKVIATTEDEHTRWQAVRSLGKITTNQQRQSVVSALQPHLSDETYENNSHLFKNCYALLWNIAQDLSYPNFYRAWHHLDTAPIWKSLLSRLCAKLRSLKP